MELSISEIIYERLPMDAADRALLLEAKIADVAAMEEEIERLRGRVAELEEDWTTRDDALDALRELVAAIDASKVGKLCRVGKLVVVEDRGALTGEASLAEALEAARGLL